MRELLCASKLVDELRRQNAAQLSQAPRHLERYPGSPRQQLDLRSALPRSFCGSDEFAGFKKGGLPIPPMRNPDASAGHRTVKVSCNLKIMRYLFHGYNAFLLFHVF
jgi:hypothetical protein